MDGNPLLEKIARFRRRLADGPAVVGPYLDFDGWQMLRALANGTRLDFVWIDLEHGALQPDGAYKAVDTLAPTGLLPIVRASSTEDTVLKRVADLGAAGIVLPQVASGEQARQAVTSCLYPPQGTRGVGPNIAANQWMVDSRDYVLAAHNESVLLIAQIESPEGAASIRDVCAVERIDVVFVGRYDLSASLGHPLEVDHPEVVRLEQDVVAVAREHGKAVGTIATTPEAFRETLGQGYDFILTTGLAKLACLGSRAFLDGV